MNQGVDIEQVKSYNRTVKEYRDKAAKIQATVEFNQGELKRLCKELSTALGKEVTEDNIEQVYAEYVAKINNTLEVGNDIIKRIQNEEASISGAVASAATTAAPVMPAAPAAPAAQAPVAPAAPAAPAGFFNSVGNNGFPTNDGSAGFGNSIFGDGMTLNPGGSFKGI